MLQEIFSPSLNRSLAVNIVAAKDKENTTTTFMFPGLGGCAAHWEPLLNSSSLSTRYILVDLLGHGENIKPKNSDYSYQTLYEDIKALFKHYATATNNIIGHSLEGTFATQLAAELSTQIDNLVLLSPKPCQINKDNPLIFCLPCWLLEKIRPLLSKEFVKLAFTTTADKQLVAQVVAASHRNPMYVIKPLVRSLKHILNIAPHSINTATLVIIGEHDNLIKQTEIETYYKQLPHVQFIKIKDVGHMALLEKPQEIAQDIMKFLQQSKNDNLA